MNPDHPHPADGLLPPLPPMKTLAEAIALAETEHDPFYITVFRCRAWLDQLISQSVAEYAEKK
ncbi:MAG TPA: hypothetical protein VNZ22_18445, partial [Bacillota bacterium]|nr:hypothetical protein [Bacillota bacterium]